MPLMRDNQAKCDRCGKLDGLPTEKKMKKGWIKRHNFELHHSENWFKFYCEDCAKAIILEEGIK